MDERVQAAIADGRIPAERAGHYESMLKSNPAQGAAVLAALAQAPPGLRPNAFPSAQQHALGIDEGPGYDPAWLKPQELAAAKAEEAGALVNPVVTLEDPSFVGHHGSAPPRGLSGPPRDDLGAYGLAGRSNDLGSFGTAGRDR